ncbi:MAG: response regulator [Burkholderiales bacterium]|nr:response regulator [Burkholderiales bacterium]
MADDVLRIVVVDDVPDVAESLADFLRLDGHNVCTAYDGQEALQVIEACHADFVMLDLGMPGMSGRELARQLRERHGNELVLVAFTGDADVDVAFSSQVAYVDHCLRKPLQVDDLAKILPRPLSAGARKRVTGIAGRSPGPDGGPPDSGWADTMSQ